MIFFCLSLLAGLRRYLYRRGAKLLLAAIISSLCCPISFAKDSPLVAAASNLQFVLPELAKSFSQDTGIKIRFSFGSSGNLSRQIRQGAPFDLFLSANESYARILTTEGLTLGDGANYARGRLSLIIPLNSSLEIDRGLDQLKDTTILQSVERLAIANPEHAPYGIAAREVLESKGLWSAVQDKLVVGENVAQATQFVVSANADAAIIAQSLAVSDSVKSRVQQIVISEALHQPLLQRMVLTNSASDNAKQFYDFLLSSKAANIFSEFGFPGEPGK